MFAMDFDMLYPREVVIIEMYIEAPKEKADLLSLREPGENFSWGSMRDGLGRRVRQSFVLRLWKPAENEHVLLEEYRRYIEYNGLALIELYLVPPYTQTLLSYLEAKFLHPIVLTVFFSLGVKLLQICSGFVRM